MDGIDDAACGFSLRTDAGAVETARVVLAGGVVAGADGGLARRAAADQDADQPAGGDRTDGAR